MSKTRNTGNLVSENNIFVDVTNDRVGIGSTQPTAKLNVSGIVSATSYYGDGSKLTGVSASGSGVELKLSGSSVGTSVTAINFNGVTVTTPVAGLSTVSVAQNLTIGVRSGSAVTFSIAGNSFNIPNRAGGNTSINV